MFATLSVLLFGLSVRFAMLTALLLIGLANIASAGNISLGSAKDFTVLEFGEKALNITSNSVIFGDVGKKKGGDKLFVSGSTVTGQLYGDSNLSIDISNSGGTNVNTGDTATTIAGDPGVNTSGKFSSKDTYHNPTYDPFVKMDMSTAVSDALAASTAAAAETANHTYSSGFSLTSGATQTINGVGGGTVVDISGGNFEIDGSGSVLTLHGGDANDYFIINYRGSNDFKITSGGAINLTGSLTASDVLWNIVNSGSKVELTGNAGSTPDAPILGTFLAADRGFNISSVETIPHGPPYERFIEGAIYGGGNGEGINITQSIIKYGPFMQPTPPPEVPEPSSAVLLGFGLIGILAFGRGRRPLV
jgi:hypothetical protein